MFTRKLIKVWFVMILTIVLALPDVGVLNPVKKAQAAPLGSTVYVFDLDQYDSNAKRADWYDLNLFVGTLQGIVNQTGPRLYIRNFNYIRPIPAVTASESSNVNTFWLDLFRQRGQWLSEATVTVLTSVDDLVNTFRSDIAGLTVWDPKVDATVNVATTMAGIEKTPIVMAGSSLYAKLTAAPFSLPVSFNLNNQFSGANAKTDAYAWAKTNYLDNGKANAGMVGWYEDGYARQATAGSPQNYAMERDYLVKNKAFVYDLSPWGDEKAGDAPEQTLGNDRSSYLSILQSDYNNWGSSWPIEAIGFVPWWDKYSDISGKGSHAAAAGEWLNVEENSKKNAPISSVLDTLGYGNASFHSWAPVGKGLTNAPKVPPRKTLQNKTYILYTMGDHDGGTLHQLPYQWNDERRGSIPIAWNVVPNFMRDYPDIAQYLYNSATPNDFFLANASGAGYANPSYMPDINIWTQWNELLYKRAGMTASGFIINGNAGEMSAATEKEYAKFSEDGLIGLESSISGTVPAVRNDNMVVAETNVSYGGYDIDGAAQAIENYAATISNLGSQPNFIVFRAPFAYPRALELIHNKIVADQPGANYEAVDPYSYFSLIRQAKDNQTNDYVTVSVDVPRNMVAGVDYDVSVTVRNVGSTTWTLANMDRLAAAASNQFIWKNLNGGYSNSVTDQRVFLSSGDSVAPQSVKTFQFTVTAPATAGTYSFATQMVRDGVAFMGASSSRSIQVVAATGDQAVITAVSAPATLVEGATGTVSVTFKNVGNTTWTAANYYRLSTIGKYSLAQKLYSTNQLIWNGFPDGGYSNADYAQRVFLATGDSIAPGQSKTFAFSVQAPAKRGKYVFSGQMIRDTVSVFGTAFEKEIIVVPSGRIGKDSELVDSTVPQFMKAGTSKRVTVSLKNLGTETWTLAGNYRLKAASTNQFTFGNYNDGGYSNSATDQQAYLSGSDQIDPEGSKSFTFDITAPASFGSYTLSVDMIQNGVASFNKTVSWTIVVGGDYDAIFTADNIPTQMAAGATIPIRLETTNKGGNTWRQSELYRLATTMNNQIKITDFGPDGGEGTGPAGQRVYLNSVERIIQGQKKEFNFSVQAPTTPGTYTLEFQMVRDGVTGFGQTKTVTVNVVSGYSKRINVGGAAFTDSSGNVWDADSAYTALQGWGYTGTTTTGSTTNTITVTGSLPAQLYQSARYGSAFGYKFDVPNGTYRVNLAFAEISKTQSAARMFSLDIEGKNVLSGFDIYKMAYASSASTGKDRGRNQVYVIDVTDGQLNLDFAGQVDQAQLNAISVDRLK